MVCPFKVKPSPYFKNAKQLTSANQNNFRKELDEILKSASRCQVSESSEAQRGHHSPTERGMRELKGEKSRGST
jgi:hypothetical protein